MHIQRKIIKDFKPVLTIYTPCIVVHFCTVLCEVMCNYTQMEKPTEPLTMRELLLTGVSIACHIHTYIHTYMYTDQNIIQ